MVPHSTPPPPPGSRRLQADSAVALRTVIAEHWRALAASEDALADVVKRVAVEAREQGLQPEELVIALKQIEQEVLGSADRLSSMDLDARRRFREWLVGACVRAYFAK